MPNPISNRPRLAEMENASSIGPRGRDGLMPLSHFSRRWGLNHLDLVWKRTIRYDFHSRLLPFADELFGLYGLISGETDETDQKRKFPTLRSREPNVGPQAIHPVPGFLEAPEFASLVGIRM